MTDPPTNLKSSIFLSSPLFVSHLLDPSSPFVLSPLSVMERKGTVRNPDFMGFEGDCDLHSFTGENETLLNGWNTSFLLDLLFNFRDLPISSIQMISSLECDGTTAGTGVQYRGLSDGSWI
jgi:hypothetical protein